MRNPHAAPPFSFGRKKAALTNTWVGVDRERGCVMGRVVEANAERLEFPLLIINGEGGGWEGSQSYTVLLGPFRSMLFQVFP